MKTKRKVFVIETPAVEGNKHFNQLPNCEHVFFFDSWTTGYKKKPQAINKCIYCGAIEN